VDKKQGKEVIAALSAITADGENAVVSECAEICAKKIKEGGFYDQAQSQCAILSGDHGFDPLVRHVQALGRTCRPAGSLNNACPCEKLPASTIVSSVWCCSSRMRISAGPLRQA